ncbi:hypothetical protein FRX31_003228, partial [Thalictrum thalictroides]
MAGALYVIFVKQLLNLLVTFSYTVIILGKFGLDCCKMFLISTVFWAVFTMKAKIFRVVKACRDWTGEEDMGN